MAARSETNTSEGRIEEAALRIGTERESREAHVVTLGGELDLSSSERLEAELQRVEQTDAERIIIDLSGLEFIDSTGIQLLLEAQARSRRDSNRISFVRGQGAVERVLELVGANSLLTFRD